MTLPNWQNLEKSLDDSETIEQAISRLITDHNNSPDSHLGVGQSLENHKMADIIDHPANSVKIDKNTFASVLYRLFFSDRSSWPQINGANSFLTES